MDGLEFDPYLLDFSEFRWFSVLSYFGTNPDDVCTLSQIPSLITFACNEADLVHGQKSRGVEAGRRAPRPMWEKCWKKNPDSTAEHLQMQGENMV